MGVVWKQRLQKQPTGLVGVDRSITFLSLDTPTEERRRYRGVVVLAKDRRDAKRKFRELEAAATDAVYANQVARFLDELGRRAQLAPAPTFQAFVQGEWIPNILNGGGMTESQVASDESILRCHLLPFFGEHSLRAINVRLIDQYKAKKAQQEHMYCTGYSASSVNNHLSLLRRVLAKAIEYELIEANPIGPRSWMKRDSIPEDSANWWRPDEEERAFGVLASWRDEYPIRYMAILVQLITGIRFSELRALRPEDLDLNVPGLWVRRSMARKKVGTPKNKRARLQVLPQPLAQELFAWRVGIDGQLLFPGPRGGPLANNSLNRWYWKLCEEAGVRRISSHGARHTSGSSYALVGAGQKMIARLLGHANASATERYTHVQVDATRPLVEARWARLSGEAEGDAK